MLENMTPEEMLECALKALSESTVEVVYLRNKLEEFKRQALVNTQELVRRQDSKYETLLETNHGQLAEISHLSEQLEAAKAYMHFVGVDFDDMFMSYKNQPNPRELAMAQTKGEFNMAVARYSDRAQISLAEARRNIKQALGLEKK